MFLVTCPCGVRIPVTAGQAGATVGCQCGQSVPVPTLGELRQSVIAAGGSLDRPPARQDWTMWWWGVGILVAGEVLTLVGAILAALFSGWNVAQGLMLVATLGLGEILAFVGVFAVGRGKGFPMWSCLLLFFCIPFGRLLMLVIPGKGTDPPE